MKNNILGLFKMVFTRFSFLSVVLLLVTIISSSFGKSYFFSDDFTSQANFDAAWDTNCPYGREGYFTDNANTSIRKIGGGKLNVTGRPLTYEVGYAYHTIMVGRAIKLTNANGLSTFTASAEDPFGFEIIRTSSRVSHSDNPGWPEDMGAIDIWLVEENYIAISNWNKYNNFVFLYEGVKNSGGWGTASRWGYFKGAETRCFLTNVKRANGTPVDISFLDFDYGGGVSNNTDIGIRITHDGSKIRFYINPDPYNQSVYPNSYCLIGETAVSFNSNLRIMIGHEDDSANGDAQFYDAQYTNILIRSVADSSSSFIFPREVPESSRVSFFTIVKTTFLEHDSGIGELTIVKPSGFTEWGDVTVSTNGVALNVVQGDTLVGINDVHISFDGDSMKVRFLQNSPLTGGVIKDNTVAIKVAFSLKTPSSDKDITSFKVFSDCVKYDNTGYGLWATTGAKKSKASFAGAMKVIVVDNTLTMLK